jgi:hypothetical protein
VGPTGARIAVGSRRRSSAEDLLAFSSSLVDGAQDVDALFTSSMSQLRQLLAADRATLFLVDRRRGEIWSRVADGGCGEIRLPIGKGIAGHVAATGDVINTAGEYSCFRVWSTTVFVSCFAHRCWCFSFTFVVATLCTACRCVQRPAV